MNGNESFSGEEFVIEAADGSFYQHYKDGLLGFLDFVLETAGDAIASGRLQSRDLQEVRRGLHALQRPAKDLFPLLAKKIDEKDPTFFDECTIAAIWEALGSVFLIAQHSGFTDSAKAHARMLQGSNAGKTSGSVRAQAADVAWRLKCLEEAIEMRRTKPSISTSALARNLWEQMPAKAGKPADSGTVRDYLADMERCGRLPKKLGRTGSA